MTVDPSKYGIAYLLSTLLNQFSVVGQISIFFAVALLLVSIFDPTSTRLSLGFALLCFAFSNHYWMVSSAGVYNQGEPRYWYQRIAKLSAILAAFFVVLHPVGASV